MWFLILKPVEMAELKALNNSVMVVQQITVDVVSKECKRYEQIEQYYWILNILRYLILKLFGITFDL